MVSLEVCGGVVPQVSTHLETTHWRMEKIAHRFAVIFVFNSPFLVGFEVNTLTDIASRTIISIGTSETFLCFFVQNSKVQNFVCFGKVEQCFCQKVGNSRNLVQN